VIYFIRHFERISIFYRAKTSSFYILEVDIDEGENQSCCKCYFI